MRVGVLEVVDCSKVSNRVTVPGGTVSQIFHLFLKSKFYTVPLFMFNDFSSPIKHGCKIGKDSSSINTDS